MAWKERLSPKTVVNVIQEQIPNVYVSQLAAHKMDIIIDESNLEVGWLCDVEKIFDNAYMIKDVFIIEQGVHATTTEITEEGLTNFAMQLAETDEGMEVFGRIKGWGHSHVNMGVSPSAQDNTQMKLFVENGCEFFIRIIANKKGEMEMGFFDYVNGRNYLNIPWKVMRSPEVMEIEAQIDALYEKIDELEQAEHDMHVEPIKAELLQKVKKLPVATSYYGGGQTSYYDRQYGKKPYEYPNQKKNQVSTISAESVTKKEEDKVDFDLINAEMSEDEILEVGAAEYYYMVRFELHKAFPDKGVDFQMKVHDFCQLYYEKYMVKAMNDAFEEEAQDEREVS